MPEYTSAIAAGPGSHDFHVKGIGGEFPEFLDQFLPEAFGKEGTVEFPPPRSKPVNEPIDHFRLVASLWRSEGDYQK
jgi:hypothetical protein